MTEAASAVTMSTNNVCKLGSVGIPIPSVNIKVKADDTELKYNEIGELMFSAPSIMKGYYKNEEETSSAIELDATGTRWLHTGDLGYVDEDGFVFIVGRTKRIFTVLGRDKNMYKLFPQRIEETISSIANIAGCAVVVTEDKEVLHKAIAFVSLSSATADAENIVSVIETKLQAELPEHMQPERIIFIENIPLTTSGKVDYHTLEDITEAWQQGKISEWAVVEKLGITHRASLDGVKS